MSDEKMLRKCGDPDAATHLHTQEAFGPVACLMGYRDLDHAAQLAKRLARIERMQRAHTLSGFFALTRSVLLDIPG